MKTSMKTFYVFRLILSKYSVKPEHQKGLRRFRHFMLSLGYVTKTAEVILLATFCFTTFRLLQFHNVISEDSS